MTQPLPGTPRQQAILRAVLDAYADDESIRTIGVFGSLARSDGDAYSDIDLDIVIPSDCLAAATGKIQHLADHLSAAGFPMLVVVRDGDRAAEMLLASLDRIDVTFHAPEASKAEVLRDLILIRGDRSGLPDTGVPAIAPDDAERRLRRLHDKLPILAVIVATSLRRAQLWKAHLALQTMRDSVMEVYGLARGSTLPVRHFLKHADRDVQAALGDTLAAYQTDSTAAALRRLIRLYRSRCDGLSAGRLSLTEAQADVLDRVEALLCDD